MNQQVLIIDCGSQYTLVIERTIRELGVRSAVYSPEGARKWLAANKPKCVILSGGPKSVFDEDAPQVPEEVFSLGVPILGICYGMQYIAKRFGGRVSSNVKEKGYGEVKVTIERPDDPLLKGMYGRYVAWESHGDAVSALTNAFQRIISSESHIYSGMSSLQSRIWGLQFHPEVHHTECGKQILSNFLFGISGCEKDWSASSLIALIQDEAERKIGNGKLLLLYSGGVDSCTKAAILRPVLGNRMLGLCIDGGQLREGEIDEIRGNARAVGVPFKIVDSTDLFQDAFAGITHAEGKRKAFQYIYGNIARQEAERFGATIVGQGTLATDKIETEAAGHIKTHHNVGVDLGNLNMFDPLSGLFKYEVRALARELGLPESISERMPFPGLGLFVRVIGAPPTPERLQIVRWADARVTEILKRTGEYCSISQLVVALFCGDLTVGVKGDGRIYGPSVVVRAVKTFDFMTASGVVFQPDTQSEIASVLTKHPSIGRALFDPTNKPPATIEFE